MKRFQKYPFLLLGLLPLLAPSCNKKSGDTVIVYESQEGEAPRRTVDDGTLRAPRMGGNVQGVFTKKSRIGSRDFYQYPQVNDLRISLTRGISGTGATYSRYGDPSRDPSYRGHGWERTMKDYPDQEKVKKMAPRDAVEDDNFYRDWMRFAEQTGMKDMILVANYFMPFSELDQLLRDLEAKGIRVLWLEADNETNSPEHVKMFEAELRRKDPRFASYNARQRFEKAFELYWDWVGELEDFADARGLPVSYVGTPPAYAFPDMLDPETMGEKANVSEKKAQSDRMFNEMGSRYVKEGRLEGMAISRHRYRQWDIVGRQVQARNDDLRRRLAYPVYRNYYLDLKETEVDFYRKLYPDAKILFTEWALRKSIAGAGHSMAAAIDVAKFLLANAQINAEYGETVVDAVTYQTLYDEKMGGLLYPDGNGLGVSPEGWAYHLFSVMDGAPILEIGNGDNTRTQWIRVQGPDGEYVCYYNLKDEPMAIPYQGGARYLQSADLLGEPVTIQSAQADRQVPAHSLGIVQLR